MGWYFCSGGEADRTMTKKNPAPMKSGSQTRWVLLRLLLRHRLPTDCHQTSANSCASVALLNIINNVPGIDLGDNLTSFKQFTKDFTPALRGYQVDHFEFVKNIHNSFARWVTSSGLFVRQTLIKLSLTGRWICLKRTCI